MKTQAKEGQKEDAPEQKKGKAEGRTEARRGRKRRPAKA